MIERACHTRRTRATIVTRVRATYWFASAGDADGHARGAGEPAAVPAAGSAAPGDAGVATSPAAGAGDSCARAVPYGHNCSTGAAEANAACQAATSVPSVAADDGCQASPGDGCEATAGCEAAAAGVVRAATSRRDDDVPDGGAAANDATASGPDHSARRPAAGACRRRDAARPPRHQRPADAEPPAALVSGGRSQRRRVNFPSLFDLASSPLSAAKENAGACLDSQCAFTVVAVTVDATPWLGLAL